MTDVAIDILLGVLTFVLINCGVMVVVMAWVVLSKIIKEGIDDELRRDKARRAKEEIEKTLEEIRARECNTRE